MEIRAAGCCMRERCENCAGACVYIYTGRTDWCSRALKSITTAAAAVGRGDAFY